MALLSLVIRGDSEANMMSWLSIIRLVVASLGSHFLVSWSVRCVVRLILVPLHNFTSAQDRRTLSTAQSCLDSLASDSRLMPTQSKKQSNRSNWHSWCVNDKLRGKFIILTYLHLLCKWCEQGCAVALP